MEGEVSQLVARPRREASPPAQLYIKQGLNTVHFSFSFSFFFFFAFMSTKVEGFTCTVWYIRHASIHPKWKWSTGDKCRQCSRTRLGQVVTWTIWPRINQTLSRTKSWGVHGGIVYKCQELHWTELWKWGVQCTVRDIHSPPVQQNCLPLDSVKLNLELSFI